MTTYIATAPDGSEVTRKSDRAYSHAVLVEGNEGWKATGFCGRLDLAHKKQIKHPGSIVVEVKSLGVTQADETKAEVTEEVVSTDMGLVGAPVTKVTASQALEPKPTIGKLVNELLMDEGLDYKSIVSRVMAEFPDAKTTTRSVASVAAVLRKKGINVPIRQKRSASPNSK